MLDEDVSAFWRSIDAESARRRAQREDAKERARALLAKPLDLVDALSTKDVTINLLATSLDWIYTLGNSIYEVLMYGEDRDAAQAIAVDLMGELDRQMDEAREAIGKAAQLGLYPILGGIEEKGPGNSVS